MKKWIHALVALSLTATSMGYADEKKDNDYEARPGSGAMDSYSEGLSLSMMGWGIGLAAGIAIVAGVLHQSQEACH